MLSGECQQNIDAKGRMVVPSKFREDLGDRFVATKGLDGCLFVFDSNTWDELERKINALSLADSRDIKRLLIGSKTELEVDKQGRVLIPQNLRQYAKIEKDIYILGLGTRAEIWSGASWEAYNNKIDADQIAEKMEQLGI